MEVTKKFCPIATEFFIRGRKLDISFVFILHSYFKVPEDILNTTTFYGNT